MKAGRLEQRIAEARDRRAKSLNWGSQNIWTLPPEIGELSELEDLNLSFNRLTTLPPELGNCTNLRTLNLVGNEITSPPPEILQQGTKAILAFLAASQHSRTRQWVSKLIIVGEGGVGKTQLLRALRDLPYDPGIETTHGIEIHKCHLPHPSQPGVGMTLNAWDFGGQQIYHATHQFFLTNRSLFILAWNSRLGYEQGRLRYWLETISALAPESPIILVATHSDQREADLPLAEFRRLYPRLAGQIEVSNRSGAGMPELRTRVAQLAATLPLMGEEWPTHWLAVAESFRSLDAKYSRRDDLVLEAAKQGVSGLDLTVLMVWLHELGDLLQYPEDDDLDDVVILQPQWVAEHIGRVLVYPSVIENNGVFRHQDMEDVWSDLDVGMRLHFLRLMERFDLSYRTLEDREVSLVVERLPLEVPDFLSRWDGALRQENTREIAMTYDLSAVPAGVPTWFIARQHRFTTHTHWRTGALFADTSGLHFSLVEVDAHERKASLRVRGPHPHDFFSLIRDGFELTLTRFPGLGVTRRVPCPGHKGVPCSHMFDYSNLLGAIERPQPILEIQCPISFEPVSVAGLLFGIHWLMRDSVLESIAGAKAELARDIGATLSALADLSAGIDTQTTLLQPRVPQAVPSRSTDGRDSLSKRLHCGARVGRQRMATNSRRAALHCSSTVRLPARGIRPWTEGDMS